MQISLVSVARVIWPRWSKLSPSLSFFLFLSPSSDGKTFRSMITCERKSVKSWQHRPCPLRNYSCRTSSWNPSGHVCFRGAECEVQNNDESIYRFISDNILPPMAITRMRALHVRISMIPLVSRRYRVFARISRKLSRRSWRTREKKKVRPRNVRQRWHIDRRTRLSPEITAITFNRRTQF